MNTEHSQYDNERTKQFEKCYKIDNDRLYTEYSGGALGRIKVSYDNLKRDYENKMYCTNVWFLNEIESIDVVPTDKSDYTDELKLYSHIIRNQINDNQKSGTIVDKKLLTKYDYIDEFLYYTKNKNQNVANILKDAKNKDGTKTTAIAKPVVHFDKRYLPNLLHYLYDIENVRIYLDLGNVEELQNLWVSFICNKLKDDNCKYIKIDHGDYTAPTLDQIIIFNKTMEKCIEDNINAVFTCYSGHGRSGFMALTYLCSKIKYEELYKNLIELLYTVFLCFKYKDIDREKYNDNFFKTTQLYIYLADNYHWEASHEIFNDFTDYKNTMLFFKRIQLLLQFIFKDAYEDAYNEILNAVNILLATKLNEINAGIFTGDEPEISFNFKKYVISTKIYKKVKIISYGETIDITLANNPYFIDYDKISDSHDNALKLLNETDPNLLVILTPLHNYHTMEGFELIANIGNITIFAINKNQKKIKCIYYGWTEGATDKQVLSNIYIVCSFIIKFIYTGFGNITIHCNSGSGRSGTVLTIIYAFFNLIEYNNKIDLNQFITNLRAVTGNEFLVESSGQFNMIKKVISLLYNTFYKYHSRPELITWYNYPVYGGPNKNYIAWNCYLIKMINNDNSLNSIIPKIKNYDNILELLKQTTSEQKEDIDANFIIYQNTMKYFAEPDIKIIIQLYNNNDDDSHAKLGKSFDANIINNDNKINNITQIKLFFLYYICIIRYLHFICKFDWVNDSPLLLTIQNMIRLNIIINREIKNGNKIITSLFNKVDSPKIFDSSKIFDSPKHLQSTLLKKTIENKLQKSNYTNLSQIYTMKKPIELQMPISDTNFSLLFCNNIIYLISLQNNDTNVHSSSLTKPSTFGGNSFTSLFRCAILVILLILLVCIVYKLYKSQKSHIKYTDFYDNDNYNYKIIIP
jgi:protein-tyrosine phosphatase